jgi:hypothetical protein
MGKEVFKNAVKLQGANFPDLETVGNNPFHGCVLLNEENVNFDKLTALSTTMFRYTEFTIGTDATVYKGPVFTSTKRVNGSLVFPEVKTIGAYAFENQVTLADAYFPELVAINGDYPFKYCAALTDVDKMNFDKLETIGKNGLAYWSGYPASVISPLPPDTPAVVTGMVISSTMRDDGTGTLVPLFPAVQTIGDAAFDWQYTMADAYFPSLKTTGKNVFRMCMALTDADKMNFDSLETIGDSTFQFWAREGAPVDGLQLYNPKLTTTMRDDGSGTMVPLFPAVQTIGARAFQWQYAMADAYFPAAVSIGNNAFRCCTLLSEGNIDFDKVTTIGEAAFYRDNAGTPPDGGIAQTGPMFELTRDAAAFPDRQLVFPAVTTLGKQAFGAGATIAMPAVIDLPAATTIGEQAFQNRNAVTTVNLPAVTSIHTNANTFVWTAITTFRVPSLPALPSATFFKGRTKLQVADISSLTALAADAFVNCPALDELYVGETPPQATAAEVFGIGTANGNTFYSGNSFTIYVPAGNDAAGTAWQGWINATLVGPGLAGNVTVTVPSPAR